VMCATPGCRPSPIDRERVLAARARGERHVVRGGAAPLAVVVEQEVVVLRVVGAVVREDVEHHAAKHPVDLQLAPGYPPRGVEQRIVVDGGQPVIGVEDRVSKSVTVTLTVTTR
jgi:hypothetical protein